MSAKAFPDIQPEQRLLIDGQLVPAASGNTYNNINPADNSVAGVCADELHPRYPRPVLHLHDQAILVAPDIEYHAMVAADARIAVLGLDVPR